MYITLQLAEVVFAGVTFAIWILYNIIHGISVVTEAFNPRRIEVSTWMDQVIDFAAALHIFQCIHLIFAQTLALMQPFVLPFLLVMICTIVILVNYICLTSHRQLPSYIFLIVLIVSMFRVLISAFVMLRGADAPTSSLKF